MLRLGLGAALAAGIFAAGAWSGSAIATARGAAAETAARLASARRAEEIRAAEVARLQQETAMDLALGRVIEDAKDMDAVRVVFDAGRMRRLFPSAD